MAGKEELLSSISPNMRLTKDFFKRIYGYEISFAGFAEQAVSTLEAVGCSQARKYYIDWVNEYETKRDAELKEVAHRYWLQCEKEWEKIQKEGEERRTRQQENLQQMSNGDLIMLLENLIGVT